MKNLSNDKKQCEQRYKYFISSRLGIGESVRQNLIFSNEFQQEDTGGVYSR